MNYEEKLLDQLREASRVQHQEALGLQLKADIARKTAAEIDALLEKWEPRCKACGKEVAGYDHDACLALPPDISPQA